MLPINLDVYASTFVTKKRKFFEIDWKKTNIIGKNLFSGLEMDFAGGCQDFEHSEIVLNIVCMEKLSLTNRNIEYEKESCVLVMLFIACFCLMTIH